MDSELHPLKPAVRNRILLLGAVLTLGNLAAVVHQSSRVYLYQQSYCFNYYITHDPTQIDLRSHVEEDMCKIDEVQSQLAITDGIDSFLSCIPALLVLATYKELLPLVGLNRLVIASLCCSALAVLYSVFNFSLHQSWTPNAILGSFVFDLVGGGEVTRMAIIITCIAQITPPERFVSGSAIGSLLLSRHVFLLNGLSFLCYILTSCVAAAIPTESGRAADDADASRPILLAVDDLDSPRSSSDRAVIPLQRSLLGILLQSWHSSYLSIITLFRVANPTFTVLFLFLFNGIAKRVEVLLPQYTSLTLHWPLSTVNLVLALKSLVTSLALFALPSLRERFLEPRMSTAEVDLFITQVSLLANAVGMVCLGFAAPAAFFILALCVYTSGMGLADSLTSYGTFTLPTAERIGDFYVRIGLINTLASMAGAPIWSGLFSFILKHGILPLGTPFWACALLFGIGTGGVMVLNRWHVDGRRA
ncbi:MAG: hypothetical protein Q9166_006947 [cf. Caloplaca sp. 2 TL-2023]